MKIFPVYVGNIAKDASVSDLRAVFGRFGNVLEVTVISEHGFVTYDSVEEASEAVRSLDGFQMCGKTLEVDYSDEMKAYFARQNRSGRHVKLLCFTCGEATQVNGSCLVFLARFIQLQYLEAREPWEHGLLRSLSSLMRSDVTSKAVWRQP